MSTFAFTYYTHSVLLRTKKEFETKQAKHNRVGWGTKLYQTRDRLCPVARFGRLKLFAPYSDWKEIARVQCALRSKFGTKDSRDTFGVRRCASSVDVFKGNSEMIRTASLISPQCDCVVRLNFHLGGEECCVCQHRRHWSPGRAVDFDCRHRHVMGKSILRSYPTRHSEWFISQSYSHIAPILAPHSHDL